MYFDSDLHRALSRKAEATDRSISRVVKEAVRLALAEDAEDLKAFQSRAHEPNLDFDNMGSCTSSHSGERPSFFPEWCVQYGIRVGQG